MKFFANFKTNHTRASTLEYIDTLNREIANLNCENVTIFPPATALCKSSGKIEIGAQNAYFTQNGAYTGELGLEQLNEFDIKTILIGHSERRQILGECQEFIAKKFEFFKNEGFKIIYCIGEPLEVRKEGEDALFEYLFAQFDGIDVDYENFIIAYEPIWAIGTGVSATVEDIKLVHNRLKEQFNKELLDGGSVKVENIEDIAKIDSVDGVLVGSASLDAKNFAKLIKKGVNG
jgi:triosephosphate isomerase